MAAQAMLFEGYGAPEPPERFALLKVRELERSSILSKGSGSLGWCDYTLNPYVGCGFNCSYCYATFFQADEERRRTWGSWVDVKINAARELLRRHDLRGKTIFMSSATDPYQPLEAKVGLTRAILEVLVEKQPKLIVQTRGPLVTRDINLIKRIKGARVNMSITTDDDEVRKVFEPSCASIERRFEAITEVKAAGIETGISVIPMLPIRDARAFAKKISATNADHVSIGCFNISDRPFAASTREEALALARDRGWDIEAYARTKRAILRNLPDRNP